MIGRELHREKELPRTFERRGLFSPLSAGRKKGNGREADPTKPERQEVFSSSEDKLRGNRPEPCSTIAKGGFLKGPESTGKS